jgi:mycolipenoyl-CoA---2-(long-chain-fatty acyl)-trehalose mycolipenoyltransferase / long-chain-acyl-CoA---trehalose acyltransferase
MVALGTIHDWSPAPGLVVSWHASPAARAKAGQAPISVVPASYQQAQHLRGFCQHAAQGLDMARLCIGAWDIVGVCDIPAMTYAINAHLRRHDTYHSWFEYKNADDIVRRTIRDSSDIEFVPTENGEMTSADLRAHILATPNPLHWDCFSFGFIQRADHFTFYMSVDHLLTDGMSAGVIFLEIHMMYAALLQSGAPIPLPDPASYHDYCIEQHQHTAALTSESPQVRTWIQFAENNDATLPDFPLPLGDLSVPSTGAMVVVPLMDEQQADRFESICKEAGARFSGGVFACAAQAEYELTGTDTYYGITPYDTRSTPAEYMTPGWFASFIPITVPVGTMSFGDTARAAQASFDSGKDLANVPFDRVLELAPSELGLKNPERDVPMLSYIDVRSIPVTSQWDELNAGIYGDSRLSDQVCVWVNRFEKETTLTVSFPENPIARESVARYVAAVKSVYARVAEGGGTAAAFAQRNPLIQVVN